MAVLPENMDRLDPQNIPGSLSTIENYIRYMGERLEFSMQNTTRAVSAAGVSNAEVYILLTALKNELAALTSTVESVRGTVTELSGKVSDLSGTVTGLTNTVTGLGQDAAGLREKQDKLSGDLAGLADRVAALEATEPPEGTE